MISMYDCIYLIIRHFFPAQIDCPNCGRSYKRRETLTRHRKFECGIEPKFNCSLCQMRFKRKDKLKEHEMKRHPRDPLLVTSSASKFKTKTSNRWPAEWTRYLTLIQNTIFPFLVNHISWCKNVCRYVSYVKWSRLWLFSLYFLY